MHQSTGKIQDSSQKTLRRARRLFVPCDQHRRNDRSTCAGRRLLWQRSHGWAGRSANRWSHARGRAASSYDRGRRSRRQAAGRRNSWPTIGSGIYRYQGLQQSERGCYGSSHEADGTRNHRLEEPWITINHRYEVGSVAKIRPNGNLDPHRCRLGNWRSPALGALGLGALHHWGAGQRGGGGVGIGTVTLTVLAQVLCVREPAICGGRWISGRQRVSHLCYQYWWHSACKNNHTAQ